MSNDHRGPRIPWALDRDILWPDLKRYVPVEDEGDVKQFILATPDPQATVYMLYRIAVRAYDAGADGRGLR